MSNPDPAEAPIVFQPYETVIIDMPVIDGPGVSVPRFKTAYDPLGMRRIDHVRLHVGNARQSAYFYRNAFGFEVLAYAGLETKTRHEAGYVLRQGDITFIVSSPLSGSHPEAYRQMLHGDGVSDVAIEVDDVKRAYNLAVERGAVGVLGPRKAEDEHGFYESASIRTYGDTTHTFVNHDGYKGVFAPGYKPSIPNATAPRPSSRPASSPSTTSSATSNWARWTSGSVSTRRCWASPSSSASTTRTSAPSTRPSCPRWCRTAPDASSSRSTSRPRPSAARRSRNTSRSTTAPACSTSPCPPATSWPRSRRCGPTTSRSCACRMAYYDALPARIGPIEEDIAQLAELGILVDRDDEGYMLQIFTKPVADRPTMFFEIIQRHGSRSFGKGNFKALFEAIEREQDRRGTL